MSMTKKVTTVWTRVPTREEDAELFAEREVFLQAAVDAGKTDSLTPTKGEDDNTYSRNWTNDTTANEWITYLNTLSAKYDIEVTSTVENI